MKTLCERTQGDVKNLCRDNARFDMSNKVVEEVC